MSRNVWSSASRNRPGSVMPAEQTSTSTGPRSSAALASTSVTRSRSLTSHGTPVAPSGSATDARRSAPRASSVSRAPFAANAMASASPIPLDPPVMTTCLPAQSMAVASHPMPAFDVDGPVGKLTRKMATSSWFRKVGPKVVPPMDRALHKVTGGRVIVSKMMVPSMVLTTTGQKSGLPRESPLACVPDGEGGWWVVGSNFGQVKHPAWTGNLIADPNASVSFEHRETAVLSHLLTEDEKAETWPKLIAVWPAYDDYVESSGRNLRV